MTARRSRFRLAAGTLAVLVAPLVVIAALGDERPTGNEATPRAANPQVGEASPFEAELIERALPQPTGRREPGTTLARPRLARPVR